MLVGMSDIQVYILIFSIPQKKNYHMLKKYEANPSRFDGPSRVIAAGFHLCNGKLIGPRDLFDDPAFDEARKRTNVIADYLRQHGPFEPHRLGLEDLEYTTMPQLMKKLEGRFIPE